MTDLSGIYLGNRAMDAESADVQRIVSPVPGVPGAYTVHYKGRDNLTHHHSIDMGQREVQSRIDKRFWLKLRLCSHGVSELDHCGDCADMEEGGWYPFWDVIVQSARYDRNVGLRPEERLS